MVDRPPSAASHYLNDQSTRAPPQGLLMLVYRCCGAWYDTRLNTRELWCVRLWTPLHRQRKMV